MTTTPDDVTLDRLIRAGSRPDPAGVDALVGPRAALLGSDGIQRSRTAWSSSLTGLGPLEPLVSEGVTDILVNGDGSVWVDAGEGLERAHADVGDEDAVRRLATRLAGMAGRRLDDSQPWVDGQLPGGIRLHAVLPPIAARGTHISLRLARRSGWSLGQLARRGMFDTRLGEVLVGLVMARLSFLVTGGTGTGKSTLLAALLAAGPSSDRIVVVEDVRELAIRHDHVVALQGRSPNVERVGSVTLVDLVRQALRMRPDRLVVGEARGAEVRELLAALNTGHAGGCATLHANRAADVPARLAALGALAGLSEAETATQVASAIDVVVHLRRSGPMRRVAEVAVLDHGVLVPALVVGSRGSAADGPGLALLAARLAGAGADADADAGAGVGAGAGVSSAASGGEVASAGHRPRGRTP